MVALAGFEPATLALSTQCSTTELQNRVWFKKASETSGAYFLNSEEFKKSLVRISTTELQNR